MKVLVRHLKATLEEERKNKEQLSMELKSLSKFCTRLKQEHHLLILRNQKSEARIKELIEDTFEVTNEKAPKPNMPEPNQLLRAIDPYIWPTVFHLPLS